MRKRVSNQLSRKRNTYGVYPFTFGSVFAVLLVVSAAAIPAAGPGLPVFLSLGALACYLAFTLDFIGYACLRDGWRCLEYPLPLFLDQLGYGASIVLGFVRFAARAAKSHVS